MKKVLIIAYNYTPMNNGGVQRPLKFAKYLPQYGYEPIIITNSNYGETNDEKNIYRFIDKNEVIKNQGKVISFIFRAIKKIMYLLGIIPDHNFLWYKEVIKNIDEIIRKEKIDIVFSTYPTISNMLIGTHIKIKYNISLVSDFRDGLVFEPLQYENYLRRIANRKIEREIVKNSDCILTVSQPITDYFKNTWNIKKAITITNGFDEDDFKNLNKKDFSDTINIIYTGRFSRSSSDIKIDNLIVAIKELDFENVNFYFYGDYSSEEIEKIESVKNVPIIIKNLVERKKALEIQKSADILLFATSKKRTSVATTKLYEYLAVKKPIFALTKGTVAEKIINETHTGICVDPDNKNEIKVALKNLIDEYPKYNFFDPVNIDKYSRINLTKKLAEVFDELIEMKNDNVLK